MASIVEKYTGENLNYKVCAMIEIPLACLRAGELAENDEFFSFGANNLTQTTLGMSSDDSNSFLPKYLEYEIIKNNPYAANDELGVGEMIIFASERGLATRKELKI